MDEKKAHRQRVVVFLVPCHDPHGEVMVAHDVPGFGHFRLSLKGPCPLKADEVDERS